MHFHNKSLIIAMAAISAIACSKVEDKINPQIQKEAKAIEFRSSFASATGEKPNFSQAGLFIGEPVSVDNAKLNIGKDGKITTEAKIYWADGQTKSSEFLAYSPYNPDYFSGELMIFDIQEDQTTEYGLTASDLYIASTSAKPSDPAVSLEFKHAMCQMLVYFNNKTGKDISTVTFKGLKTTLSIAVPGGIVSTTDKTADIKAYKDTELGCFKAFVPAQTGALSIEIMLSDGKKISCKSKELKLESGKYYDNSKSPLALASDEDAKDDLTENSESGIYTIRDGIASQMLVLSSGVQVCSGKRGSFTTFSIIDNNSFKFLFCKIESSTISTGSRIAAVITCGGDSALPAGNINFDVVKVENGKYWLRSEDGTIGIISNQ